MCVRCFHSLCAYNVMMCLVLFLSSFSSQDLDQALLLGTHHIPYFKSAHTHTQLHPALCDLVDTVPKMTRGL